MKKTEKGKKRVNKRTEAALGTPDKRKKQLSMDSPSIPESPGTPGAKITRKEKTSGAFARSALVLCEGIEFGVYFMFRLWGRLLRAKKRISK